jgi:UDP:flavonoid glycosyltransferase YjiC (YdhE family)
MRRPRRSGARPRDGVFLYRTVGDNEALEEFCDAFADLDRRVLIATGSEELRRKLAARVEHAGFDVRSMWNMSAVLDRVGVAVHHGGPGVTLGCLAGGIPAVALPGDSPERQLYGATLESLGLGASLSAEPSLATSWHAAVDTTQRMPGWHEVRRLVDSLRTSDEVWRRCGSWSERLVDLEPDAAIAAIDALNRNGGS